NDKNVPRGKTLNLLCNALQLNISEFQVESQQKNNFGTALMNVASLIFLNLVLMTIFGFLTLDSNANINSKIAAILLSLFIPYFIVIQTPLLSGLQRVFRFGTGLISYLILVAVKNNFPQDLLLGFYPSLLLVICILYYGNVIIKS